MPVLYIRLSYNNFVLPETALWMTVVCCALGAFTLRTIQVTMSASLSPSNLAVAAIAVMRKHGVFLSDVLSTPRLRNRKQHLTH
jgi:hypothetical protein